MTIGTLDPDATPMMVAEYQFQDGTTVSLDHVEDWDMFSLNSTQYQLTVDDGETTAEYRVMSSHNEARDAARGRHISIHRGIELAPYGEMDRGQSWDDLEMQDDFMQGYVDFLAASGAKNTEDLAQEYAHAVGRKNNLEALGHDTHGFETSVAAGYEPETTSLLEKITARF